MQRSCISSRKLNRQRAADRGQPNFGESCVLISVTASYRITWIIITVNVGTLSSGYHDLRKLERRMLTFQIGRDDLNPLVQHLDGAVLGREVLCDN